MSSILFCLEVIEDVNIWITYSYKLSDTRKITFPTRCNFFEKTKVRNPRANVCPISADLTDFTCPELVRSYP